MAAFNANDPTASGMVLTFDDEFNTASVSSDSVADGTLWNDHLWYEAPSDGVTVSNGIATIVNTDLSTVNSSGQGFAQTYGYFEADLELPNGIGAWPAFWLMSQAHAQNGSNPASEIDIMEGQGSDPDLYFTTLHYDTGTTSDTYNPNPNWTANLGVDLETSFHRYGLLWSPNSSQITFYFDGTPVATANKYSTTDYSPDMVILSTSEGNMIGNNAPNGTSPPLYADYVRVYQFTSQDPTAVIAQTVSPPAGDTDPTVLANADGVTPGSDATTSGSDPTTTGSDPATTGSDPTTTGSDPTTTGSDPATTGTGTAAASPDGTIVTGSDGDIVSAAGNDYAINAAGQITENGTVMAVTHAVSELAYIDGTVYQEATAQNLWWSYNETTNTWTETGDPLANTDPSTGSTTPSEPSADGTIVTAANVDLVSAAGNVFAIDAAGQITENGTVMAVTHTVSELAYIDGTVYQEATAQNLWWSYNETTNIWTETSDPLANTDPSTGSTTPSEPSADGTIVTAANVDIVSAAGNVFAIDAAGQITENGTIMPATHTVTELAYVDGTVYQEATAQNLWWSYNETTNVWTETSDPLATTGMQSQPPNLTIHDASGIEGSSIPLSIAASQAASDLADANLTINIEGPTGTTFNEGTPNADGVYTLDHSQLASLTVTPPSGFTGTLPLIVFATDTESSSGTIASSNPQELDVTVTATGTDPASSGSSTAPATTTAAATTDATTLAPAFTDGAHDIYLVSAMPQSPEQITAFNPSEDVLDLAPLLKSLGYTGSNPVADHVVNLVQTSDGSTAVMVDPTGANPDHGTTVLTLDHVLPQSVPVADIWH